MPKTSTERVAAYRKRNGAKQVELHAADLVLIDKVCLAFHGKIFPSELPGVKSLPHLSSSLREKILFLLAVASTKVDGPEGVVLRHRLSK